MLVVEDDPRIAEPLREGLAREGYDVVVVATGADALGADPTDLVLLDLGLPDLDGQVVCRELRSRSSVPIIVISARGEEIDRVMLLELGADDYVVKPFGFRELVARIRAVARRAAAEASPATASTISVGALTIDRRTRRVAFRGDAVSLTPKEYDLLAYLAIDPGAVKGREPAHARRVGRELVGLDQNARRAHRIAAQETGTRSDRNGAGRRVPAGGSAGARSVTRRLLASYLLITALTLVLLEVPLGVFFAQRERERIAADLEHDANVLATLYVDDLENDRPLDPAPATAYGERTGARVVVVDPDGISLIDTAGPIERDFSTRPEIAEALSGQSATGTRSSDTLATDILYVAVPVASSGTVHGALRLTIDTSDVTARIHRFWLALTAIAVVIIGLVAIVGWWLARSVTSPGATIAGRRRPLC